MATVDIKKGDKARGIYMDAQENIDMQAASDVPLGHKIALKAHSSNDSVIKYGHDIGKVVENIKPGEHVEPIPKPIQSRVFSTNNAALGGFGMACTYSQP